MKEQIINLFERIGQRRITFNPAVKFQRDTTQQAMWMDDITKVNDVLILTVSTLHDNRKANLNEFSPAELAPLKNRLNSIVNTAKKERA